MENPDIFLFLKIWLFHFKYGVDSNTNHISKLYRFERLIAKNNLSECIRSQNVNFNIKLSIFGLCHLVPHLFHGIQTLFLLCTWLILQTAFCVSMEFYLNGKVWVKTYCVEYISWNAKNRKERCNYLMLTIQWLSRTFEFYYTYVELSPPFYCTRNSRFMEFEIKFTLFDTLPCTKLLETYY